MESNIADSYPPLWLTETCRLYLDQSEVKQILIAACHSHFPRFDPPAGFVLTPDWFTTKYVSVLIRQSELRLCLKVVKGKHVIIQTPMKDQVNFRAKTWYLHTSKKYKFASKRTLDYFPTKYPVYADNWLVVTDSSESRNGERLGSSCRMQYLIILLGL